MFSNGDSSPMFEVESDLGTDEGQIEVKTIEIATYTYLNKISMVVKDLNKLSGLQLVDQDDNFASQANWDTRSSNSRLSPKTLTNSQSLIGILVNTDSTVYIPRIGFIIANLPDVEVSELSFGKPIVNGVQYPDEDVIPQIDFDWGHLLKEIRFKTDQTHFGLQAIQLVFNDAQSEMIHASTSAEEYETQVLNVDQWQEIRAVQMLMVEDTGVMEGIRLLDEDQETIHQVLWGL